MPFFCGQMLIMQISIIRIVTTKKSATSQQISNWKILAIALTSFGTFGLIYASYFALSLISQMPFSYLVEVCYSPDTETRAMLPLKLVFFQHHHNCPGDNVDQIPSEGEHANKCNSLFSNEHYQ